MFCGGPTGANTTDGGPGCAGPVCAGLLVGGLLVGGPIAAFQGVHVLSVISCIYQPVVLAFGRRSGQFKVVCQKVSTVQLAFDSVDAAEVANKTHCVAAYARSGVGDCAVGSVNAVRFQLSNNPVRGCLG